MSSTKAERSLYIQKDLGGLAERVSMYARRKMFANLMTLTGANAVTRVLDVGVTCDSRSDSNFFEKMYPYPENVVGLGTEDGAFLEKDFPGFTFVKGDGLALPFADKSFDLVVSFAVLEHVGNRQNQQKFLAEMLRVGKAICFTTPNRWYPMEFHTAKPFLHWLPPELFRACVRWIGDDFFSREENLNLLSERDIRALLPRDAKIQTKHVRLLGPVSNLLFYVTASS